MKLPADIFQSGEADPAPSPPQLGIPHSFALISYQHKFQDDDQTRVKGSLK